MWRGGNHFRHRGLVKVWLVIFCTISALGRVTCVPPQEIDLNAPIQEGVQVETPTVETPQAHALKPGPARFETLFAYFQAANPDLFSHFESLQKRHAAREDHWGLSYVAGTSGVGKSYLVRNMAMFDKAIAATIKLSSLFEETLPDLKTLDGEIVFNRLPCAAAFDVQSLLDTVDPDKVFILIDDLDEVHEQTARAILKALEAYVAEPRSGFKQLVVFGRPESFWPWLHDPARIGLPQVTPSPLVLKGPEYKTYGDISFRCQDYYRFKFGKDAPQAVIDDVIAQVNRFPFLRDTMRPLSAGNYVLDDSVARCDTGTPLLNSAEALQTRLFEQLLARNQKSHGRPGSDNAAYLTLLQQAAALPWAHGRIPDKQGFFSVFEKDTLSLTDDHGQVHEVSARDVLNRSGLVTLDVTESRVARYRFEPVWVQRFLVDQVPHPYVSLFNGTDLNGWVPVGTPDAFTVKENAIHTTGAGPYPSWLRTEKAYENFVLRFEYQTQGWYEGGVLFHAPLHGPASRLGFKLHLRHDAKAYGVRSPGAIYDAAAPLRIANLPSGQWNRCEVDCRWPRLRITLNDTLIHDIDMAQHKAFGPKLRKGYIGIQNIGCRGAFRHIEIQTYPDQMQWTPLFASGLAGLGTEGDTEWDMDHDTLTGKNKNGFAFTRQAFKAPFELQVWVKTMTNGNGGVLFNYGHQSVEVQCFNAPDSTNPTGSLYGIAPAQNVVSRDNEWFLLHILNEGSHATVRVNGETVCETDALKPPFQGRIAFQQHTPGGTIHYRGARIHTRRR